MHMRICTIMKPIEYIRQKKFRVSQAAFAAFAGVSQPTVSRWESGDLEPSREELDRIRSKASELGMAWEDCWFFDDPPADVACEAAS